MQPILLQPNCSFVAGTYYTDQFENGWHQHPAYELILFTEGSGHSNIGMQSIRFEQGNIYLLGANLPHCFRPDNQLCAIIIHFTADCLGKHFFSLPECRIFSQLLKRATYGLRINSNKHSLLQSLIQSLPTATDGNRIILLLQCLQLLATEKEYTFLSTGYDNGLNSTDNDYLDRVIKFTTHAFRDPVSLSKVAAIACKSIPSFCHYFKIHTQKTYINYLNEVRINYACRQLLQTNKPVVDIGYESGYNTIAHFHRQFLRLRKTTPLRYRKSFSTQLIRIV